MKFCNSGLYENLSNKIQVLLFCGTCPSIENLYHILLGMRNVPYKVCRENYNTRFMSNNFVIRLYDNVTKNIVDPDKPQITV